ncbi:protein serine/threonine phosphatase 2C [Neocallimastix californiae]|jgi:serine/threonine protein phosphatase PrpC|uniref:Protein serine/threonine phosphatase 2C n=1 Tax=Neocallimastix californiae TaxID=1754190 RepID=A0A1Y2AP45_9FUNG|nr:protein serine/threonine phosphatase 2C [Neocallimastix californiae]|eukprot:ORY24343.1 protein serine/threonine phosphatase 2C [Neocallimastix californiae]
MATSVISPNQIEAKSTKYMQNNEYSSSPSQSEGIIQEMEPNCSESNANGKRGMTRSDTIETLLVDDGSVPLESGPNELSSPNSAKSSGSDNNKKQTTSNEIDTAIQLNKKNIINEFNRDIKWTVATERGYEKGPNKTRKPIHNYMEDFHFPTIDNKNAAVHLHPVSGLPVYIWLLADGHGGHEAPQFFIKEMRAAMEDIVDFHDWNWEKKEECQLFERFVKDKYKEIDKKFCDMKTEEFKAWKAGGFKGDKPLDDGCTFIVNIIYKNMHINCNVGDSRTVLGRRENIKRGLFSHRESVWNQVFGSRDHAPELSDMAYHISQNGGIFLNQNGSKRIHGAIVPPSKRGTKSYSDLVGTRIYRAVNEGISDIGISNMRTLNMGATMGDLLFKIEPAVLSNDPDVTFNKLNANKDYLLVIASDGVWDYLKYDYSATQMNNNLLEFLGLSMSSSIQKKMAADGVKVDKKNVNLSEISSEILEDIAKLIVQRDYVKEVYCQGLDKFDDCTAFLVFIPAVNNNAKQNNL